MKKALFLSYDGLTDNLGQSQVLPYLIGLTEKGVRFHVISFEKKELYTTLNKNITALCEKHNINWHPQFYTKKPPVFSTLKDLRNMEKSAIALQQREGFDIIHCRSYLPGMVGRRLKHKFNCKFLFDIRGFWADERVEGGIWNLKNPLYRFIYLYFKRKETELFKSADHVISLTYSAKKILLSTEKWKLNDAQITVIPCCVDMELFDPEKIRDTQLETLRKALQIEKKNTVLGYVGSIGTWYMLEEMLDFFKVQFEKNEQLLFLFITNEPIATIYKIAVKKGIPKTALRIASTTHKYVPLHIALFDFSVFFIRPSFSKQASSPTKQGELMAMGVPVICNNKVGDTASIVNTHHSGKIVEDFDHESYAKIELTNTDFDAANIRQQADKVFGLKNGVVAYWKVYSDLD
jgi:glycosyltransferase involved in cell wall biosynthesis